MILECSTLHCEYNELYFQRLVKPGTNALRVLLDNEVSSCISCQTESLYQVCCNFLQYDLSVSSLKYAFLQIILQDVLVWQLELRSMFMK